jgi:prepilin peptidase CpaA
MPVSIFVFIMIQLVAVSYIDLTSKKISNAWIILNLIVFLALLFSFGENYKLKLSAFAYSLAFLGVGFFLHLAKFLGAGDSKYLFSLYFLIPEELQNHAFICLLYSTMTIGSLVMAANMLINVRSLRLAFVNRDFRLFKVIIGKKFSFAPVILLSWLIFGVTARGSLYLYAK